MLLIVPILMSGLLDCQTIDDLTNQLKATGEPVITSLVPSEAKVAGIVTVRGVNFGTTAGKLGFQDGNGNVAVADITGWADDFVVVKVPPLSGNPPTAKVHLVTSAGKIVAINPSLNVTY